MESLRNLLMESTVSMKTFLISMMVVVVAVVGFNAGLLIYVSSSLGEEISNMELIVNDTNKTTKTLFSELRDVEDKIDGLDTTLYYDVQDINSAIDDVEKLVKATRWDVDTILWDLDDIKGDVDDIESDVNDIKWHFNIW